MIPVSSLQHYNPHRQSLLMLGVIYKPFSGEGDFLGLRQLVVHSAAAHICPVWRISEGSNENGVLDEPPDCHGNLPDALDFNEERDNS